MGLIKAAIDAGRSTLADQWLEYVYCERMDDDVLMRRGMSKKGGSNLKGTDNILTNGSKIVVSEDQCLVVVSEGKIVDFTTEAGRYTYDKGSQPSMFYGGFGKGIIDSFKEFGGRFISGGVVPHDERVYFINTRHIKGNKFGTSTPIPFRDSEFGLTVDIRCYGEYVFQVTDPIKFYHTFGGNVEGDYVIDSSFREQFSADFLQALQPALGKVAMQRVSYDMLPGAVKEISEAVNEELDSTWGEQGINVVRVSIASATPTEESAEKVKAAQNDRLYAMNPAMQGARANAAASEAIKDAANNDAGAMTGFMGVGMLNQGGAMFGANISEQSKSGMMMTDMNTPGSMMGEPVIEETKAEVNEVSNDSENKVEETVKNDTSVRYCSNCGALVSGKFCCECGTKYEDVGPKKCPNCGVEVEDGYKFCGEFGTKLN